MRRAGQGYASAVLSFPFLLSQKANAPLMLQVGRLLIVKAYNRSIVPKTAVISVMVLHLERQNAPCSSLAGTPPDTMRFQNVCASNVSTNTHSSGKPSNRIGPGHNSLISLQS
jgi:hypothetical protein